MSVKRAQSILNSRYTLNLIFGNNSFIRVMHGRAVIDHFHKWRLIINSFERIKIRLTNLILKLVIQKNFDSETRLVRVI